MSSKRTNSPQGSLGSEPKRPRVTSESQGESPRPAAAQLKSDEELDDEAAAVESLMPTHRHLARCGIQRSIALVLRHDGFSSATPEAMESFTSLVESCEPFPLSLATPPLLTRP